MQGHVSNTVDLVTLLSCCL